MEQPKKERQYQPNNRETRTISSQEYTECESLLRDIHTFTITHGHKNLIPREEVKKLQSTILDKKELIDKALRTMNGFGIGIRIASAITQDIPDPITRAVIHNLLKKHLGKLDREMSNEEALGVLGGQHAIYAELVGGLALRERALNKDHSQTTDVLKKHARYIKEGALSSYMQKNYIAALTQLVEEDDAESAAILRKVIIAPFEQRDLLSKSLEELVRIILLYACTNTKNITLKLLQSRLGGEKSYANMIEAWKSAGPNLKNNIKRNLESILKLEQEQPGAVGILYNNFGICNTGRYPETMLLAQVRQKDDITHPYGIILYPLSDKNGAYFLEKKVFEKMFQDAQGIYHIRVTEAGSTSEIARRLVDLDTTYGEHEKISFAIVGGHGSKKRIRFGDNPISGDINTEDLINASFREEQGKKSGIARTKKFFTNHPMIALISCHVGEKGAPGEYISSLYGATVIGPSGAVWIKNISLRKEHGKPIIEVEYMKTGTTEKLEGILYDKGEEQL